MSEYTLPQIRLYAEIAHEGQKRKNSGEPYINHPIMVMEMLKIWGVNDKDVLAAALLHDTVEDTHVTIDEIREVANDRVASIVDELTIVADNRIQKAVEIAKFKDKSPEAVLIKVADRICNIFDFAITCQENTIEYYEAGFPIFKSFVGKKSGIVSLFGDEVFDEAYRCYYNFAKNFIASFQDFLSEVNCFSTAYFLNRNINDKSAIDLL